MLYTFLRKLLNVVFRVLWRPVIEGGEHVPATGPVIIAANHLSFIDSIVIPLALPGRQVTFLAKSEYFTEGGILALPRRAFLRVMAAVAVQRGEHGDAQAALNTALDVLHKGLAFGIYPEGTRSRDGRLYRGRTGVGWLALAAKAPVVPVGLTGTDRVQPVGARVPRVHRVGIRFGPPVWPEQYADVTPPARARRRLTDDVMDAVAALSGQDRAPGYNEHRSGTESA